MEISATSKHYSYLWNLIQKKIETHVKTENSAIMET